MSNTLNPRNISPSALYTSYVWVRHGLSPPAMKTWRGLWYYLWMQPLEWFARMSGNVTLEEMLVTRHRCIDRLLQDQLNPIDDLQVVELAAGLSFRGVRTLSTQATACTRYTEGDLADITRLKSRLFRNQGWLSPNHQLLAFDLLDPNSYASLKATLEPSLKTLIIAEGILSYFTPKNVQFVLNQCQQVIASTQGGSFICDAHLRDEVTGVRGSGLFKKLQSRFVKSPMELPWKNEQEALAMLKEAGFKNAEILQAHQIMDHGRRRDGVVRIVQANSG